MLIAVVSDSHNNKDSVKKAILYMRDNGIDLCIHCGDITKPSVLELFKKAGIRIFVVFGNMDSRDILTDSFQNSPEIKLQGDLGELYIDNKKIAFTHYPEIAQNMAKQGVFDAVFYGHTHKFKIDKTDDMIMVNPGELAGLHGVKSFVVYNTMKNAINKVNI